MTINDFTVQLATAYPDAKLIGTSKGRTLRGDIETDHGTVQAYIKLLTVGDIAREALCSVLARKLNLPVPQPYYVFIDRVITGQSYNLHGIAFGLEQETMPFPRITDKAILAKELSKWPELNRCAAFDAWIANRDRIPNNLLFAGEHSFWMIDHDEALPSYLSASSPVGAQLFDIIKIGRSEHELYRVREQQIEFSERFKNIDWDEIRELVRESDLPESQKYFGSYISTLRERALHMRSILNSELGIKQLSIEFDGDTKGSNEVSKK